MTPQEVADRLLFAPDDVLRGEAVEMIRSLDRWKEEALIVIAQWEEVWEHAGRPGQIGVSKSQAVADEIDRLRGEIADVYDMVARCEKLDDLLAIGKRIRERQQGRSETRVAPEQRISDGTADPTLPGARWDGQPWDYWRSEPRRQAEA